MRNIRLTIQYDGTNYNGWQIQRTDNRSPNTETKTQKIITIQGTIQNAIKKITGEDVKLIGAGRTDAGVHAIAQVASFKTSSRLSQEVIKKALNASLPDDIRIIDACDVELDFHPRYDAKSKIYFYVICNSHIISPFLYRYVWKIPHQLNFDRMSKAIEFLKGRQDFSSFRASGCSAKNTVRTILHISIEKLDAIDFMNTRVECSFLKLSIEADAFLRHMVRNIIGTIVEVGKGKIKAEDVKKIILSRDRRLAGPTAPASGLFLEKINYQTFTK